MVFEKMFDAKITNLYAEIANGNQCFKLEIRYVDISSKLRTKKIILPFRTEKDRMYRDKNLSYILEYGKGNIIYDNIINGDHYLLTYNKNYSILNLVVIDLLTGGAATVSGNFNFKYMMEVYKYGKKIWK